jgi:hypothetical protein
MQDETNVKNPKRSLEDNENNEIESEEGPKQKKKKGILFCKRQLFC